MCPNCECALPAEAYACGVCGYERPLPPYQQDPRTAIIAVFALVGFLTGSWVTLTNLGCFGFLVWPAGGWFGTRLGIVVGTVVGSIIHR